MKKNKDGEENINETQNTDKAERLMILSICLDTCK